MSIDAAQLRDALTETAAGHGPGLVGLVGRTVVLAQNGIDLNDALTSDNPFVAAALA